MKQIFIRCACSMKSGHKRTQSDHCFSADRKQKQSFKIPFSQNNKSIFQLLKKGTMNNKIKTVLIETLEIPRARSYQDLVFSFGQQTHSSAMSPSSPGPYTLLPIQQKKLNRNSSRTRQSSQKDRRSVKKCNSWRESQGWKTEKKNSDRKKVNNKQRGQIDLKKWSGGGQKLKKGYKGEAGLNKSKVLKVKINKP